jgi:23S rRNA (cytidine1920-2'-O)/16S rRNA (cytidine1409-2'-O)-methyltransferase
MPKTRLDLLMVERGLSESRSLAQRLIMAGQVRVNGQVVYKPATSIATDSKLELDMGPRFVSRGGEKLEAAFQAWPIDVTGCVCADVGASTGGFTDCLLQHGASKVYAIDVGKGILHWKLRSDPRIVVMEETNARFVESLPEPVQWVVCDASFISLKILLPVMKRWTPLSLPPNSVNLGGEKEGGDGLIVLIKPQFEAGRKESAKGDGVIRDPDVHRRVLEEVLTLAKENGFTVKGLIRSPVLGPKGNVEFLAWLTMSGESISLEDAIQTALAG